jgi:Tetratricopeptide repeat
MTRGRLPVLALAMTIGLAGTAAAESPAARPAIGRPVQQAQILVREKKYEAALAKLKEAASVRNPSPYEAYIIAETRAAAFLASGNDAEAAGALEAVLATRFLAPAEAAQRLLTLVELEYRLKDWPKTVAMAKRYQAAGGRARAPQLLMAQALYLEGDFAGAAQSLAARARADAAEGRPADESLLRTLASAADKAGDEAGYVDALERLARLDSKPDYWRPLLHAVAAKPGFAPRLALALDRLMVATGAMTSETQYVEAAERALQAGFPGDAENFLAKGREAGLLGTGAGAAREQRLADMARHLARADAATLASLGAEADRARDGLAAVKLGEAYASYGRYDAAIAALAKGLAKGGLEHADDARLDLGIAYLHKGEADKAKAVLLSIAGDDGTADLARLWLIADRVP